MNKYVATFLFYFTTVIFLFLLNRVSPATHEEGWGFGSAGILLIVLLVLVMFVINLIKGIKLHKSYFILAAVHFIALIAGIKLILSF